MLKCEKLFFDKILDHQVFIYLKNKKYFILIVNRKLNAFIF